MPITSGRSSSRVRSRMRQMGVILPAYSLFRRVAVKTESPRFFHLRHNLCRQAIDRALIGAEIRLADFRDVLTRSGHEDGNWLVGAQRQRLNRRLGRYVPAEVRNVE